MLHTSANGASVRDREKEIGTGDGQTSRTTKGEVIIEPTKTFLNVIFWRILDSVDQMLAVMHVGS